MSQRRSNPFARPGPGASGTGSLNGRPQSAVFLTPPQLQPQPAVPAVSAAPAPAAHSRNQSLGSISRPVAGSIGRAQRSDSKNGAPSSSTFAPSFIKTEEVRRGSEVVEGIEGENDFSGKRYVWVKDPQVAFVKGWIVEELGEGRNLVQCDDGTVSGPEPVLVPAPRLSMAV